MFKISIKTLDNVIDAVFIVNFEHIFTPFSSVSTVDFEQAKY